MFNTNWENSLVEKKELELMFLKLLDSNKDFAVITIKEYDELSELKNVYSNLIKKEESILIQNALLKKLLICYLLSITIVFFVSITLALYHSYFPS